MIFSHRENSGKGTLLDSWTGSVIPGTYTQRPDVTGENALGRLRRGEGPGEIMSNTGSASRGYESNITALSEIISIISPSEEWRLGVAPTRLSAQF